MAINSVDYLKQTENNCFSVSTTGGANIIRKKYWGNGFMELSVSVFNTTYPIVLKEFPYDFRIIEATFYNGSFGKTAHAISLFHTTSLASRCIARFPLTSSRLCTLPTVLNFNKTSVSTNHKLLLHLSGASAVKFNGVLSLRIKPI